MEMLTSLGISKDLIADLLINIISIIVLYLVVKKLAYNPVKKFLDARTAKVEEQKTLAEKNLLEANELKEKYDKLLKDCDSTKADALKEGVATAEKEAKIILDNAKEEAKAIVDKATKTAQIKEQEAIDNSREQIIDLALDASSALLKRQLGDADNKKIIEDFLTSINGNGDINA